MMMHTFATTHAVMPGLVPGIHAFAARKEDVDGRDKPGHDGVPVSSFQF